MNHYRVKLEDAEEYDATLLIIVKDSEFESDYFYKNEIMGNKRTDLKYSKKEKTILIEFESEAIKLKETDSIYGEILKRNKFKITCGYYLNEELQKYNCAKDVKLNTVESLPPYLN